MELKNFIYQGTPSKIVFGAGVFTQVADFVSKLGCKRAMVLSTPQQGADAARLATMLGPLSAGVFNNATMHTPVEVTNQALAAMQSLEADCTVAFGGGSTTGLGKAIAYRLDTPQIVIPTTYAGSEVTPILGQTENGEKTTVKHSSILPELVIYDPQLTLGLPYAMSVTSGLNAMAHAAEALYAKDSNPISTMMASEGLRAFAQALPLLREDPQNLSARSAALYGAWLCGTVLGTVGMSLHHKLCHVLGGSFELPHAETHAVILAHAVQFNEEAAFEALAPVRSIFGGSTAGAALYDFAKSLGAPTSLKELGMAEKDLERAADIATRNAYWNPRKLEREQILALLQAAWRGERPEN